MSLHSKGRMSNALRILSLLVALVVPSVASADPFDDAYNAGETAFGSKDYGKARAEFQRAYDLRHEPIVLYNIAQTYRFEGDSKQAIEYYRRFLAESNTAIDLRQKSESYIKDLEAKLAGTAKPSDNAVVQPPPTKPVEPGPQLPIAADERKRRIPLGSKIAAGVTGVGLISALVFTKIGIDAEKDLKNNPNATQADADKVERDQNLINISWGITGAAAITAVVIYFAAPGYATDTKNVAIAPNRDGGWSAAFTARF